MMRAPLTLAPPPFTLFKLLGNAKTKKKKAQWRCVRISPAKSDVLFAAISHTGGPGWVVAASMSTAKVARCARVGSAPVTALDVSADATLVAAATSEGELVVLNAATLQRLVRMTPHDIFITNLRFSAHSAVVTCAGDNSIAFTPLTAEMLEPSSANLWMGMLVVLVAVAAALFQMMGSPATSPATSPIQMMGSLDEAGAA